jgi:hypothetical protein
MKKYLALVAFVLVCAFNTLFAQTLPVPAGGLNYGNGNIVKESSGNGAPTGACLGISKYTQLDATPGQNTWQCVSGSWVQQVSGGSTVNPAPPSLAVQFNNSTFGGDASFTFNPSTKTLNTQNLINSAMAQTDNLVTLLPKIDPRNTKWLAAPYNCANVADPTGVLDSTCAIAASFTYQQSGPIGTGIGSCVYLSSGQYKVSGNIANIISAGCFIGDAAANTQINLQQGTTYTPLINVAVGAGLATRSFYMAHIAIQGTGAVATGGAPNPANGVILLIRDTQYVHLDDVWMSNFAGTPISMYGHAERNYFSDINVLESNNCLKMGEQTNENVGFRFDCINPGNDLTGNCYQVGINCTSAHQLPAANAGHYCPGLTPWTASHLYRKGEMICDSNNNAEVAILNTTAATSGATPPTWPTGLNGTVMESTAGVPNAPDGSGPPIWQNIQNTTLWYPNHTGAMYLDGTINIFERSSCKSLFTQACILNAGGSTYFLDGYFEGSFGGLPRINPAVEAGSGDFGADSSVLSASITTTANTFQVADATNIPRPGFLAPADAPTGDTPMPLIFYPKDYTPGSSSASICGGGITQANFEIVSTTAFDPTNKGYVATNGRCQTGSNGCTGGSNTGIAWPASCTLVGSNIVGGSITVENSHMSSSQSDVGTGYFGLVSDTGNFQFSDGSGRQGSLASGGVLVGPIPDGKAYTGIGTVGGLGGSTFSNRGAITLMWPTEVTPAYNAYYGGRFAVVPLYGNVTMFEGIGSSATNIPQNVQSGCVSKLTSGFGVYFACQFPNIALGTYDNPLTQEKMIPGTGTGQFTGVSQSGFSQQPFGINGVLIGNQYCQAAMATGLTASTQPAARVCIDAGPSLIPQWHYDVCNLASCSFSQWQTIATINQNGITTTGAGIPQMGVSANWVQNSINIGTGTSFSTGWTNILTNIAALTPGQTDPYGGTNATQIVTTTQTSGQNGEVVNVASSSFSPNQTVTTCVWAKGAAGGEPVFVDANTTGNTLPMNELGGASGLTTTWQRYCFTGVNLSTGGANRTFRFGIAQSTPALIFFLYNPQTQAGTTAGPDEVTTPNSIFTLSSIMQAMVGSFDNLADSTGSTGSSGQQATAQGGGPWKWVTPTPPPPPIPIRAGVVTITSPATTQAVTFSTPTSAVPTSCSLTPTSSAATTGTPFATSITVNGFTANVPVAGTLTMTYSCDIDNAN